ncbi:hypothetical protein [Acinetobacter sp. P1(2025)]|uniref:hypothetical protein n=1 Tax=Acinetobacter sp. P1(2025) TaxID=3446120 RepID=UPI003F52FD3F
MSNKENKKHKRKTFSYGNAKLSSALFVLSQMALRKNFEILVLTNSKSHDSKQAVTALRSEYRKLQAMRTRILHNLIKRKKAILINYVIVNGIAYGLASFCDNKFYVPIAKKIIAYYGLEKVGDSFPDLALFDIEYLRKNVLPIPMAVKVCEEYLEYMDWFYQCIELEKASSKAEK